MPRFAAALAGLACLAGATTLTACGSSSHDASKHAQRVASSRPAPLGDVEAADSSPLPSGVRGTKSAPLPSALPKPKVPTGDDAGSRISPGAPSDDEVRAELKQMERVQKATREGPGGKATTVSDAGNARTPIDAPEAVAAIIAGGNQIARFPYVYGGGHGSFVDTAYDCSGSVSYALAAAGLLKSPLTSGDLARWGAPGPGKWVTIYANAGHTFMYVAGLRFDTSGRDGPFGSRWQSAPRSLAGFTVRHPPGL